MKNYVLISILISFIVSGCFSRESIFDKASIDSSDVPKIIAYDPNEALTTEIPQNTMISVLFSLPMDRTSVEEAFRFSYDGQEYHYSNVDWSHDDRLFSVGPLPSIPIDTMVTVTINYSAHSEEKGIHLEETHEWVFKVSTGEYTGNPSVSDWSPPLNDVIFTDTPISITFDREMLRSTVEASFSLSDSSDYRSVDDGAITWTDKTMTFEPNEPLYYDKYYTMSLNNPGVICRDLSGNELAGFQSEFFTIDNAIYVSQPPIGSDSNPGYHSSLPVATIQEGITKALSNGFTHLKIAEGSYTEDITLNADIYDDFQFQGGWEPVLFNPDIDPSSYIAEVSPPALNNFTFTLSDVSGVIIDGLKINGGNVASQNNGAVLINSDSSGITIQNCSIEGGSAGTTHGIYISDNASVTIQDNNEINGGSTNTDTFGIYVENNASAYIYRNTILGGETNANPSNNYGIYVNSASNCNIYNNFITGGGNSTHINNDSCGIYASGTDVRIINNTINGGGNSSGTDISNAVRINDSPWDIDPLIVNNIIIAGNNFFKRGIFLESSSSPPYTCTILNNTFNNDCDYYILDYQTITEINDSTALNPQPSGNEDYIDGNIIFSILPYDYFVESGTDLIKIEDNGYPLGNLSIFSTGVPNDAELDRFGNDRDLSTIDRGAHEFNP